MSTDCPYCAGPLDVRISTYMAGIGGTSGQPVHEVALIPLRGHPGILRELLIRWWRWNSEGRPKGRYDNDHNHIAYDAGKDQYEFSIQTLDSPEGDVWERGTFRVEGNFRIVDLSVSPQRSR